MSPQICPLEQLEDVVSRLESADRSCDSGNTSNLMRHTAMRDFKSQVDNALFEIETMSHGLARRLGCYVRLIGVLKKWEPDVKQRLESAQWDYVSNDENVAWLEGLAEIKKPSE